jgi:hypothetical protein
MARKGVDPRLWNFATDYDMNRTLQKMGFDLPQGGLMATTQTGEQIDQFNHTEGQWIHMNPNNWPEFQNSGLEELKFEITNLGADEIADELEKYFDQIQDEDQKERAKQAMDDNENPDGDSHEQMGPSQGQEGEESDSENGDSDEQQDTSALDDILNDAMEASGEDEQSDEEQPDERDDQSDETDRAADGDNKTGDIDINSFVTTCAEQNDWIIPTMNFLGITAPPPVIPPATAKQALSVTEPGLDFPAMDSIPTSGGGTMDILAPNIPSWQPPDTETPKPAPSRTVSAGVILDTSLSMSQYNGEWMAEKLYCMLMVAKSNNYILELGFVSNTNAPTDLNYQAKEIVRSDMSDDEIYNLILTGYQQAAGDDNIYPSALAMKYNTQYNDWMYFTDTEWHGSPGSAEQAQQETNKPADDTPFPPSRLALMAPHGRMSQYEAEKIHEINQYYSGGNDRPITFDTFDIVSNNLRY